MRYVFFRHPVKKVAAGLFKDPGAIDALKTSAGLIDNLADALDVQRPDGAIIQGDMKLAGIGLDRLFFMRLFRTKSGALFTVKDVGSSHLMVFTAHEDQLDLILNIFNVKRSA